MARGRSTSFILLNDGVTSLIGLHDILDHILYDLGMWEVVGKTRGVEGGGGFL